MGKHDKTKKSKLKGTHLEAEAAATERDSSSVETYKAIGRLNHKHLERAETWDIRYLGCVPDVEDWHTPNTRTEFMELIDEGQAAGHLMWSSTNVKSLHVSPSWLLISDRAKKVLYMELPTATVGSLSYAEDENRHFLGLKAAIVSKDGRSQFCCYILECDSEMHVRRICARINEIFEILATRQHSKQPNQGVGSRMLRRLSPSAGLSRAKEKPLDMLGSQRKLAKALSHQAVGTPAQKTDDGDVGASSCFAQEDIDSMEDEIDRQFSLVYNDPLESRVQFEIDTRQQPPGVIRSPRNHQQEPPIVVRSPHDQHQQPGGGNHTSQAHQPVHEFSSSSGSDGEEEEGSNVVLPLHINQVSCHDGAVHHQAMADTTNVVVPDRRDILVPKGKGRTSLLDNQDLFLPDTNMLPVTQAPSGLSKQPDLTTPPSSPGHMVEPRSPSELLALRVRTLLMQTTH